MMSAISEDLNGIKALCKDGIRQIIFRLTNDMDARIALQAKVDSAIDQISSPAAINYRYVDDNISLERYFIGEMVESDSLKALIGASLVLFKSFSQESVSADLEPFEMFYQRTVEGRLGEYFSKDVLLKTFAKWMFFAVHGVSILATGNQAVLINICAMLENMPTVDRAIKKYTSGGGKTDAMLHRLYIYELIAGNQEKAQKHFEKIIKTKNSINKTGRQKPGPGSLTLLFEPEEIEKLALWPDDNYAQLRDQLSSRAHFTSYLPEQEKFLEAVHVLFSDIPYFAAILYHPLAIYCDQLFVWQSTNPTDLAQLPEENNVLDAYLAGVDVKNVNKNDHHITFGDMKIKLRMALIASKIVFLQKHYNSVLLPANDVSIEEFQLNFVNLLEFTDVEKATLDFYEKEWDWMLKYRNVVALIKATTNKANQEVYFEVGQRMEGSGRKYTKGGSCTVAAWRRLLIIDLITNDVPIPRRRKPRQLTERTKEKGEHDRETETNVEGKKRRKVIKADKSKTNNKALSTSHAASSLDDKPLPSLNCDVNLSDLFDTDELMNIVSKAEDRGDVSIQYQPTGTGAASSINKGDLILQTGITNMSLEGSQSTVEDPDMLPGITDAESLPAKESSKHALGNGEQHEVYLMSISTLASIRSNEGKEEA